MGRQFPLAEGWIGPTGDAPAYPPKLLHPQRRPPAPAPLTDKEIAHAQRLDQGRRLQAAATGEVLGPNAKPRHEAAWDRQRRFQERGDEWRRANGWAWQDLPAPLGPAPSRNECHLRNPSAPKVPRSLGRRPLTSPQAWRPPSPLEPPAARAAVYRLRQGLRRIQRPRIAACGYCIAPDGDGVGVVANAEGRCRYDGVISCGSVWECPSCARNIKAKRAEELRALLQRHGAQGRALAPEAAQRAGADRAVLLTLTIRHGIGDDLAELTSKLADAWRATCRGKPWARFKLSLGVVGTVRALELTHGPNGWHPHLHVLVLIDRPVPEHEVFETAAGAEWLPSQIAYHRGAPTGTLRSWLIERWQTMVGRYIGEAHVPDDEHGLSLRPSSSADYISKLGLEVSDPGAKRGRRSSHRTPLEIADDYVTSRRPRDANLWRTYCAAMKGHRQLTWTVGLKDRYRIDERPDADLAEDEEPTPDDVLVAHLPREVWQDVRATKIAGQAAACWLLEQVERSGAQALPSIVSTITRERRKAASNTKRRTA